MPAVIDLLAHTFWYSHHMATVHFENGKYHVHYQYAEESKKKFPGNNNHSLKNETSHTDYLVYTHQYNFSLNKISSDLFVMGYYLLQKKIAQKDYPPPKI
jgi:hypothetical protein